MSPPGAACSGGARVVAGRCELARAGVQSSALGGTAAVDPPQSESMTAEQLTKTGHVPSGGARRRTARARTRTGQTHSAVGRLGGPR